MISYFNFAYADKLFVYKEKHLISDLETADVYGVEDLPTVVYFENGIPFVYMGNFLNYLDILGGLEFMILTQDIIFQLRIGREIICLQGKAADFWFSNCCLLWKWNSIHVHG